MESDERKVLVFHNIASSYYKNCLFNALYEQYKNLLVVHLSETREIRGWGTDLSGLHYPYEVLFKGNLESVGTIRMLTSVVKVLFRENPDIVYVGGYSYFSYWAVVIWGRIFRKKIISEINSNKDDHKRVYHKELMKKIFVKMCDRVVTYGEKSKTYLRQIGVKEGKIVIKPNVTGSTYFNPEPRDLPDTLDHAKNILYIGRLSKEKNLNLLIEAFYRAKKDAFSVATLVIIGDGPEEKHLRCMVEELGVKDVKFIGFVNKEDIASYFVNSEVFVLPSTSEPWGLVVNEAMMCGLPVVVSSHCGCSLDLVDGNGYIFNPNSVSELSSILGNYMQGKEDILAQRKCSLSKISRFTPHAAASILSSIFWKMQS